MEDHLNINSQFVPYELSLKLKELGFDEPCLAFYTQNAYGSFAQKLQYFVEPVDGINSDHVFVAAPLWQQAARFLNSISDNQINITINGKDDYEGLCKKFEKAIKYLRDL